MGTCKKADSPARWAVARLLAVPRANLFPEDGFDPEDGFEPVERCDGHHHDDRVQRPDGIDPDR